MPRILSDALLCESGCYPTKEQSDQESDVTSASEIVPPAQYGYSYFDGTVNRVVPVVDGMSH